jgi:hypothetical protein
MVRWFVVLILLIGMSLIFAQDVATSLDSAKQLFIKGDFSDALQQIQIAKDQIEKAQMANSGNVYIDVPNWNAVKINPAKYKGMKVKTVATMGGIWDDGTVYIIPVGTGNTFDLSIADKIGTLQAFMEYIWYGEVVLGKNNGVSIRIEKVE